VTLAGRIRGCLLGGAIGDALGAPVEFLSLAEIRRLHGPAGVEDLLWHDSGRRGAITDDTQMTLFTVEGLIRSCGSGVAGAVHAAHRRWYGTQMFPAPPGVDAPQTGTVLLMDGWLASQSWLYARRAPGNACLSGLRWDTMHTPQNPANPNSKGCGGVMRSAPFGLVSAWSPEQAFDLAAECAVQTHGHPSGYLASGAFAAVVRYLLADVSLEDAVTLVLPLLDARGGGEETATALRTALSATREGRPSAERLEQLGGAGSPRRP
jgi:ADP-ribosylglycohydrolase